MALLELNGLTTTISTPGGLVRAVQEVTLTVPHGQTVALVGESGSGKSMTARSIMGLLPGTARIVSGSIRLDGLELTELSSETLRSLRGSRMAMVFQEPMTSLNPVLRIGEQLMEPLLLHRGMERPVARAESAALLRHVGIGDSELRLRDYPHQLSGGQRQRVMIAMALACNPALLIADEPTTALDVTIQAQILELIDRLQKEQGLALLLITHDLGIVAERADQLHVMYAGRIVESAATAELLARPAHPYTRGLLASLPGNVPPVTPLTTIPGQPPDLTGEQTGCPFRSRCPAALPPCDTAMPELTTMAPGHTVRCWNHQ